MPQISGFKIKNEYKIIGLAVLLGLVVVVIDSFVDYFIFYDKPLMDQLIFDVPAVELYMRLIILIIFVIFGIIISKVTAKYNLAEQERRESQENYRNIIETAFEGICLLDEESRIKFVNPRLVSILGFEDHELVGRSIYDFLDSGMLKQAEKRWETRRQGAKDVYEAKFRHKQGHEVWTMISAAPQFDADGTFTGSLSLITDITQSKQAEEALKESEEKFRLISEQSLLGLMIIQDNKVKYVNQATSDINEYSIEEIMNWEGKDFSKVNHPDDQEFVMQQLRKKQQGNQDMVPGYQYRIITKSGNIKWVELYSKTITYQGKNADLATLIDITAKKISEQEQEKLGIQLQQAQKMEAVGTLAGGIAHDFNNLLQAINGYTQMLLMGKEGNDPDVKDLKAIQQAGDRAAQLVRQLLAFSRKVDSQRKPVDINQEITNIKGLLERTIPRMIEIELKLEKGLRTVAADPAQIEQILVNLGTNARDAMPEGGRLVIETENIFLDDEYCRSHLEASPGHYVMMTVSDTGAGMDDETVAHIFDPFYTTKEVGKGTGLGLASVYGIIKEHDGFITCYSEPGRGTTFKIYLPTAPEPATASDPGSGAIEMTGGDETVLVVDDEDWITDMAGSILEKFGYNVILKSSGEAALDTFREQKGQIDLVILDLGMPGMGGHKCMKELLKIDPELQVLIASGYSLNGQTKETLESGAAGFIGKPYQLTDLLLKVRQVLDR